MERTMIFKRISSIFKNATAGMKESYAHDQELKREKELRRDFKTTSGRHKSMTNMVGDIIMFLIILTILCSCVMYYVLKETKKIETFELAEESRIISEAILAIKGEVEAKSTTQLKDISRNITDEIYDSFDMVALQAQMTSGNYPDDLKVVFRKNIINKCTITGLDPAYNNIFICNYDGIIADFSNVYASEKEARTWQYEYSKSANPEMFQATIKHIIDQNMNTLFVEEIKYPDDYNTSDNNKFVTMTRNDLVAIYKEHGLDGLKQYNFFVPVYVMENNDIFGTNDIDDGVKVKNNKFIIIQRYNLYDYIKKYNLDTELETLTAQNFDRLSSVIYLYIIVNIVCVLAMLMHVLSTVNKVGRDCYERCYSEIEKEVLSKNNTSRPQVSSNQSGRNNDPLDISSFAGRRSYDRYAMKIMTMAYEEKEKQEKLKKETEEQTETEATDTTVVEPKESNEN